MQILHLFCLLSCIFKAANSQGLGLASNAGAMNQSSNTVTYTVIVNNETPVPIDVYFFTKPAKFDAVDGLYTNSLGTETVQPGTTQAKFIVEYSTFAAAQRFERPTGSLQSTSVALVPIGIKTDSQVGQLTNLYFDKNDEPVLSHPGVPVGLMGAAGVMVDGSFQIQTPVYSSGKGTYGIGLGVIKNGEYLLSSYTISQPGQITNVQPVVEFFVAIGRIEKGVDANYYSISSTSARCDATGGTTRFMVARTNDGRWRVNGNIQ